MKKLLASLLALTMLLSAAVCSAVAEAASLSGEWYADLFGLTFTLTLNEDGTYAMDMTGEESTSGTWTFDGTNIIMDAGTDEEAVLTYDGESISISIEGFDLQFTREAPASFEPAAARTDTALEEFAGSWELTTVGMMGMYVSPDIIGASIVLNISGTDVTYIITEEGGEPMEVKLEAAFADGTLTFADPTAGDTEGMSTACISMLEDGTLCMVATSEDVEFAYFLSPMAQ